MIRLPLMDCSRARDELDWRPQHTAIEALEAYEYPVVAELNGHAIGGGHPACAGAAGTGEGCGFL
jgi:enoyl-CoA hydratase/carnithine racemase